MMAVSNRQVSRPYRNWHKDGGVREWLVTVKEGDLVTDFRFTKIDDAHAFAKAQGQVNSAGRVGITRPERRKVTDKRPHGPKPARAHDLWEPKP